MRKLMLGFFASLGLWPLAAVPVYAHCPLCVAGAGAGLTLSRLLGVDDSITGVWIGAFLGAVSFWSEGYIFKFFKTTSLVGRSILRPAIYALVVFATLVSFYQFNLVNRMSQIAGLDKLTFGILLGAFAFYFVDMVNDAVIKKNGRVFFPYQRIVVSLGTMAVVSLGVYVLINYYI